MIKFLDKHRFILIILILLIISLLFFSAKTYIFFHHNFNKLPCTSNIDDNYCYNNEIKVLKNVSYVEVFFNNNETEIASLIKNYKLPKFSNYTAYYYEVVALLDYNITAKNEHIYDFFHTYNATFNIAEFYLQNHFYFEIFYPYKIN